MLGVLFEQFGIVAFVKVLPSFALVKSPFLDVAVVLGDLVKFLVVPENGCGEGGGENAEIVKVH